jgi:hypothetical protein
MAGLARFLKHMYDLSLTALMQEEAGGGHAD